MMLKILKNPVRAPLWVGFLLERFPLISNFYTVTYQKEKTDSYAYFKKRENPSKEYHPLRAIGGAFLHDFLNPIRLLDSILTTILRLIDFCIVSPLLELLYLLERPLKKEKPFSPGALLTGISFLVILPFQIIRVLSGFFTKLQLDTFYSWTADDIPEHPITWPICKFNFSMFFFNLFSWRGPLHSINQTLHIEPGILDIQQQNAALSSFKWEYQQSGALLKEKYTGTITPNPGLIYFFGDLVYQSIKKILQKLNVVAKPEPDVDLKAFEAKLSSPNRIIDLDETALEYAIKNASPSVLYKIASSEVYQKQINHHRHADGKTPLHLAAQHMKPEGIEIARILIENGADVGMIDREDNSYRTQLDLKNPKELKRREILYSIEVDYKKHQKTQKSCMR